MTPIKMKDTLLSTEVELYQLGLPDPFGANALIWFNGKTNGRELSSHPDLSVYFDKQCWMTINVTRLKPIE